MFSKLSFLRSVALVSTTSVVFGATPAIGIVTASGHFLVEKSQVWGNSTVFDGATIETTQASSDVALKSGVKVQLGAKSKARIFERRLALEKGTGQANGAYEIDAAGLKITGERVRVSVTDRIEVAAFAGSAKVVNGSGTMMAAIPAGRAMTFAMQAGQTGTVTRTGCLLYKDGHYILQDENTQEVVEVTGGNLAQNTGNRVEASGTVSSARPAVSGATSVVNVASVTTRSQGGCLSVASALDAKTEAPAAGAPSSPSSASAKTVPAAKSGGGLSTGAKVAIVAVVAGGGAGAALALAGKKSSTSP